MNKKLLIAGVCIVMGFAMLFTTAFASLQGSTGYEFYKDALKETIKAKSITGNFSVKVDDNGETLMKMDANVKYNHETGAMSSRTVFASGEEEMNIDVYRVDGETIVKNSDSDIYYKSMDTHREDYDYKRAHEEGTGEHAMGMGELVIDALAGDMKDYVEYDENSDGSKDVALELSGSRIPAVANALVSIAVSSAVKEGDRAYISDRHHMTPFDVNLKPQMPELVEDIRIEKADAKARINSDNLIENQTIDIKITGKDANGTKHEVVLGIYMTLSGFDATTPDTIDLAGKQVETFVPRDYEHRD